MQDRRVDRRSKCTSRVNLNVKKGAIRNDFFFFFFERVPPPFVILLFCGRNCSYLATKSCQTCWVRKIIVFSWVKKASRNVKNCTDEQHQVSKYTTVLLYIVYFIF